MIKGLEQKAALILFYLGKEPDNLEDFAKYWGMLEFALEFEGKYKRLITVHG